MPSHRAPTLADAFRNAMLREVDTAMYSPVVNALLARVPSLPAAPFGFSLGLLPRLEPEVPESEREAVAWANLAQNPWDLWAYDQDGYRVYRWDYGKNTLYGWHIHHRLDQALGGRHTASNLVARHWLGNTRAGASLGALLRQG
jgi:hypothetical protein